MPLSSHLAPPAFRFAAFSLALVLLAGCDSNNPGGSLRDLDGSYVLDELVFDHNAQVIPDANIGARLVADATILEIFSGNARATLVSQFQGQGRRLNNLNASASRGRLTLSAVTATDQSNLADLFLPPSFSMSYETANPSILTANIPLSNVNLQAFDPEQYSSLTNESGTLRVRFRRL